MLLCVELKVSMAAEGLYLKIPASISHTVFTKKTELRDLGEWGNHIPQYQRSAIFSS